MSPLKLVAAGVTDVGQVRDGNEDGFLDEARRLNLVAVADGMGGHRGGEVASATALEALRRAMASGQALPDAIEGANDAVLEKSGSDYQLQGMGTTLTAGTLGTDGNMLIGHVGDSRAYLLRDGQLTQITDDHSLVEEMVRGGELTPEQAESHPQRSIITRALGIDPAVDVDVYPVELRPGDRILLCSDGLTTMVRTDEIEEILAAEPDARRAAQRLVDAANAAGGEDNITALVVEVVEDDHNATATVRAAPVVGEADDEDDTTETDTEPRRPRRRRGLVRRIARVLVWVVPVLVILALAFGAVGWYARGTYFVGVNQSRVTIFKGRPGGVLGWNPTVERRTTLDTSQLSESERDDVRAKKTFSSRGGAEDYVRRLRKAVDERSTATTVPAPPETTVPPITAAPAALRP
jgi:serine/threonine protein phosphatase PrpC